MLTVREAMPRFSKPASVINFSSVTFHLGPTDMAAYVASKGGILAMSRSLARELGPSGVRVNTISPGWIMTERQLEQFVDDETKAFILERQCQPALLQPSEIAEVALFLASSASAAITGQEILADRGWYFS
jgi:NAD(P)-dependent dehydrogenase (short-subunit alcohol dehydrogenase family)